MSSWVVRQKKDIFVKQARYHNYRSRAAFKLIQIDDKYKILHPGKIVIDVGASPGSWTQVICKRLNLSDTAETNTIPSQNKAGMCIALDLKKIEPVPGAICLNNVDFTSPFTQSKLLEWLDDRKVDCILSDMSPNSCGQKYLDHERIMKLNYKLVQFAIQVLKPNTGVLVSKVFAGEDIHDFTLKLGHLFKKARNFKPEASREDSREHYLVCTEFKGSETP